ncbi:Thioredoxin domain-containing protein [Melia azedarach]|uniref:Thioredoxin domain-containing protein n=1 Tax=Melia azedarach TaxID=155640 RepID=A0ACC1XL67_MELAZ|nr:Thioredoxin domain-containing protein [Melia azedarach]
MGGAQALKRIPRIKFPQRHPKPSDSASQSLVASTSVDIDPSIFSRSKASSTVGGKASLQPKRTPVSNEEIEAIMVYKIYFFCNYWKLIVMDKSNLF